MAFKNEEQLKKMKREDRVAYAENELGVTFPRYLNGEKMVEEILRIQGIKERKRKPGRPAKS